MHSGVGAARRGMVTLALLIAALETGEPTLAPAQEQSQTLTLAAASGPRFLAVPDGGAKAGAPRWRDVSNAAIFRRRISLAFTDIPLGQALAEIGRKAGLRLTYSPAIVRVGNRVTLNASDLTVGSALSAVLYDAGVDLLVTGSGQAALVKRVVLQRQTGTLVGRVTDQKSGTGLADATVAVEGTQLQSVSGADGRYRIPLVPLGAQVITARRIGYARSSRPVTVTEEQMTVDFALAVSTLELEEIVVTGTAGALERREQPAVVASIDAADVVARAPVADLTQLLQARVPGVVISGGSGESGTASRINIRGASSLNLSNQPLVFIDGVRMDSRQRDLVNAYGNGVGGQTVSGINDINPDDIERIEVVKGPAAATLYGADASAGVIQIITKKGTVGARHFSQSITTEYNDVDPNFTPRSTFAACGELAGVVPACADKTASDIVSANVLQRDGVFRHGRLASLQYSARGGGDSYGYYVSGGIDDENGTLPKSGSERKSGHASFEWAPNPKVRLQSSLGLNHNQVRLPHGDDGIFAYLLGAYLGSPLTVGVPEAGNGWLLPNWGVPAGSSIDERVTTLRTTPTLQLDYTPLSWLSNRLIVGADYSRSSGRAFYPLNPFGWYSAITETSNGLIQETRSDITTYTVDYLGSIKTGFGRDHRYSSDFAFGLQYIDETDDLVRGTGQGLATNSADVVSAAANVSGGQDFSRIKSLGYFAQEQLGVADRLFLQVGARIDQNSSFGSETPSFFLPKAGVSYVISQEPFWKGVAQTIPTLRLRAAYGTTGRAPSPGASLQTFTPQPFILDGTLQPGVAPLNQGNPNLKAERGKELELGVDADLFNGRAGIEFTYFRKVTSDLLLRRPIPPSLGFSSNPYANIGEVSNRGLEFSVHGTVLDMPNLAWDLRLTGSTLRNRLVSLGDVAPFDIFNQRYAPDQSLGDFFTHRIRSVDTQNGVVIISDTAEFVGHALPTFEANLSSSVTLFRNLTISGLLETKRGHRVYDLSGEVDDRESQNTREAALPADQGGWSDAERLRRLGPYQTETTGELFTAGFGIAQEDYIRDANFVRFRELSATWSLPRGLARGFGASGASLTLGVRNLALWTDYPGDPEVLNRGPGAADSPSLAQFRVTNEWTVPQSRHWVARLNLQF